jgi:hypothetical protein
MNARPLSLCLLAALLGGFPAFAQTEPRPDAAKPDGSGQLEKRR